VDLRLYNEDPRPVEIELKESFEMARKELGCSKKTLCVLQLEGAWYNYFVEILCQDTTSKIWEP
jgi:hypothetical protein